MPDQLTRPIEPETAISSGPDADQAIPLVELDRYWMQLRPRPNVERDEAQSKALLQFLNRCVQQGRYHDDPQGRESLQTLAAEVAETLYWAGFETFPDAVILPADRAAGTPLRAAARPQVSIAHLVQPTFAKPSGRLIGRWGELSQLDDAWLGERTHVVCIEGMGGSGKSALITYWVNVLAQRGFTVNQQPLDAVFGWSFYSGGSGNYRTEGPERFLAAALEFFGGNSAGTNQGNPGTRGCRLAELIRNRRVLLLLDGLEPLQEPPLRKRAGKKDRRQTGAITDPDLAALVRELAASSAGLCVITTRLAVADLGNWTPPLVVRIQLQPLPPEDGAELLREYKLDGTQLELQEAAESVRGHCLSLALLGAFLRDAAEGDARRWREIDLLPDRGEPLRGEAEERVYYARGVMAGYEKWLPSRSRSKADGPELCLLRLLTLFDHPARLDAVWAVLAEPDIPGMTEGLASPDRELLSSTIVELEKYGLLSVTRPDLVAATAEMLLDLHPLVREYFGEKFRDQQPEAWSKGHRRLYEHYRSQAVALPTTIEEIAPLYQAVVHACRAGLFSDALHQVIQPRIHQGDRRYSWLQLGAFSTELAALSHFFARPWVQVIREIDKEEDKDYLRYSALYCLRALGRLKDVEGAVQANLKSLEERKLWSNTSKLLEFLSEQRLLRGEFREAESTARKALECAERAQNTEEQRNRLARLGDVLHQRGQFADAAAAFQDAETLQGTIDVSRPLLHGFWGFHLADFLISQGEQLALGQMNEVELGWETGDEFFDEPFLPAGVSVQVRAVGRFRKVLDRLRETEQWLTDAYSLLDAGLTRLARGKAYLALAGYDDERRAAHLSQAQEELFPAADLLRRSNQQPHLPYGLTTLALLCRLQRRWASAESFLDEALVIAKRGGMTRMLADIYLEAAHCHLEQGKIGEARDCFSAAKSLVLQMGYNRRQAEVQELEVECNVMRKR